jgi:hypothetical protein
MVSGDLLESDAGLGSTVVTGMGSAVGTGSGILAGALRVSVSGVGLAVGSGTYGGTLEEPSEGGYPITSRFA